jgi:hypothetical protein
LFGLIGVIGASLGGAGKMSATTSLNAMGGMMKGWQEGRADLFKREKETFDKFGYNPKGFYNGLSYYLVRSVPSFVISNYIYSILA